MEISMTSFIDFTIKNGGPKLTCARQINTQINEEYSPITDYYKRFREGVQELHRNKLDKNELMNVIGRLPENKVVHYEKMISGYTTFLGRKKVIWFEPERKIWKSGKIEIPINPEIGLELNGKKHLIKLYLKTNKPSKTKVSGILAMMDSVLDSSDCTLSLLDVRNAKLYDFEKKMSDLMPLVKGEAKALESIIESL